MSCGGNCACAKMAAEEKKDETCAPPIGGVMLDSEGKCPCGKSKEECCHKDAINREA